MLFDASTVYAAGQPHGAVGYSDYQNVNRLGRYDLSRLTPTNVLLGLLGLLVAAWLAHRYLGFKP